MPADNSFITTFFRQPVLLINTRRKNPYGMTFTFMGSSGVAHIVNIFHNYKKTAIKILNKKHNTAYTGTKPYYNTSFITLVLIFFALIITQNATLYAQNAESFKNKIEHARQEGSELDEAKYLNKLAYHLWNEGNYQTALDKFKQSLAINKSLGNTHAVVVINNNIGMIYNKLDQFDKALTHFHKVLEIRKQNGNNTQVAEALLNIAITHETANNYQKAVESTKKALEKFKETKNLKKVKTCYGMLAEDYEKLGNGEKSLENYNAYSSLEKHLQKKQLQKNRQKFDSIQAAVDAINKKVAQKQKEISAKKQTLKNTSKKLEKIEELNNERQKQIKLLNKQKAKQKARIEREAMIRYFILSAAALLIVIILLIYRSYKRQKRDSEILSQQKAEISQQKNDIEKKNEEISHAHQNIQSSINYARKIQDALLPQKHEINQYLKESFIFFKPRDVVSGDFYWFHTTSDGKFLLAAVDCTGHGVPGAFMSMIGFNHLNEIVAENYNSPADILTQLHKRIKGSLKQDETENADGMDMAICAIDQYHQTLEFAGANNPLAYSQNGEMQIIKGDKYAIGGKQQGTERTFTNHSIALDKETVCYIYSDGYQDQTGGSEGRKFMSKAFKRFLGEIHELPMHEQEEKMETTLNDWMGQENRQVDDILVIGFRI